LSSFVTPVKGLLALWIFHVHCDDDGYVVATQIGTCRDLDDYGLRWNGASDEENY
jgi:hypothetical protein